MKNKSNFLSKKEFKRGEFDIVYIDYEEFLEITKMSESNFKNQAKKYKIKSLESKGYIVKNIDGIGTKAIFHCEISDELKTMMQLKEVLGINVKYPKVMEEYLKLLCSDESEFYLSKSDGEIANILLHCFDLKYSSLKVYISHCRKELVECGWMKPIVTDRRSSVATKRRFVLKNTTTKKSKDISSDEFLNNYRDIYYPEVQKLERDYLISSQSVSLSKEQRKQIRSQAKEKLQNVIEGNMYVVYKKEFKIGGFDD